MGSYTCKYCGKHHNGSGSWTSYSYCSQKCQLESYKTSNEDARKYNEEVIKANLENENNNLKFDFLLYSIKCDDLQEVKKILSEGYSVHIKQIPKIIELISDNINGTLVYVLNYLKKFPDSFEEITLSQFRELQKKGLVNSELISKYELYLEKKEKLRLQKEEKQKIEKEQEHFLRNIKNDTYEKMEKIITTEEMYNTLLKFVFIDKIINNTIIAVLNIYPKGYIKFLLNFINCNKITTTQLKIIMNKGCLNLDSIYEELLKKEEIQTQENERKQLLLKQESERKKRIFITKIVYSSVFIALGLILLINKINLNFENKYKIIIPEITYLIPLTLIITGTVSIFTIVISKFKSISTSFSISFLITSISTFSFLVILSNPAISQYNYSAIMTLPYIFSIIFFILLLIGEIILNFILKKHIIHIQTIILSTFISSPIVYLKYGFENIVYNQLLLLFVQLVVFSIIYYRRFKNNNFLNEPGRYIVILGFILIYILNPIYSYFVKSFPKITNTIELIILITVVLLLIIILINFLSTQDIEAVIAFIILIVIFVVVKNKLVGHTILSFYLLIIPILLFDIDKSNSFLLSLFIIGIAVLIYVLGFSSDVKMNRNKTINISQITDTVKTNETDKVLPKTLTKEYVQSIIKSIIPKVKTCGIKKTIKTKFQINKDGTVSNIEIIDIKGDLAKCITNKIKDLKFNKFDGDVIPIIFPFKVD